MTLDKRAKIEVEKLGRKVKSDVVKGLKAIQEMYNISKKSKGSAYRTYIAQHKKA